MGCPEESRNGKGGIGEKIGQRGMGGTGRRNDRVWVVRERGADISPLPLGSCGAPWSLLSSSPFMCTELWGILYRSLPFDRALAFLGFGPLRVCEGLFPLLPQVGTGGPGSFLREGLNFWILRGPAIVNPFGVPPTCVPGPSSAS